MDLEKLKQWSKEEFICSCGLITKNSRKKEHLVSETHYWLKRSNFTNISGKSIVQCERCNKSVMVCGYASHMKNHF